MKNKSEQEARFLENCRYLGLKYLAGGYRDIIDKANACDMGFKEFIEKIVEDEAAAKKERSIQYRVDKSRLPKPYKLLGDFDFDFQPSLKKRLIMDLASLDFIEQKESLLLIGDPGTGKSHIARGIAFKACQKRYRVLYTTCADMLNDLNQGVYEKTLPLRLRKYIIPQLLVIDEMGHDRLELEVTKEAHLLFKVIDGRYNHNKSLIFTTNVEETDWGDFLGDPISTKAILDRVFHHSIKIEIKGPSYRQHEGKKLQEKYAQKQENTT